MAEPALELHRPVGDTVKTTTCYMCACRCGIRVHIKDGVVRYIEGNRDHPKNKGVLCAKGSAGIMQHLSPARLTQPLKRVGPRGSGQFETISWDEAMGLATTWLSAIRHSDPRKLAFFTGRDQSQALTGWWASQFGTPNYAAHGGFCSVNMAAAGLYTLGGAFWEFGEPDWHHTRYLMMFGVAEDHDSNPIKMGLGALKTRGEAKFVSVNPVRTGYSAIADEWVGIRPGSDGMLVGALIHELVRAGRIDGPFLARYTNAGWLIYDEPGAARHGLFVRTDAGEPLVWDEVTGTPQPWSGTVRAALGGAYTLPDGSTVQPSLRPLLARFADAAYSPERAAEVTGIDAATIRRLAAELAHAAFDQALVIDQPWTDVWGVEHAQMIGRPVSFHAMRGISAHANGFHTCRMLHVLQALLGAVDTPGSWRYKPPYPKPIPPALKPTGKPDQILAGQPMPGPPLGFPMGPEDLLVEADGTPRRIDKAFSWDAPMASHGMMHMVIANAYRGDPYPIDTLFLYMANMAWNSAMNTAGTMEMLTAQHPGGEYVIPRIIYADAYASEMVAYADLVLPDTTYLERWDCISLQDRPISDADTVADAIRQPVVAPDRDVRAFQDVLIDLGHRLGLPGLTNPDGGARYPGLYADYIVRHERAPGVGLLAGHRGDGSAEGKGPPNPAQLDAYIEGGCFWAKTLPVEHRYFRFANRGYLDWAVAMGFVGHADAIALQLYSEPLQKFRLAAEGHGAIQPPDHHRARIAAYFDPVPLWYPPFEEATVSREAFPMHAITQRPMAMYHAWGSQNAWLRQIHTANRLYIHRGTGSALGLESEDWVWVVSHHGRIRCQVTLMDGVNPGTVWTWNAIGKRRGTWGLDADAPEATRGFLLNHLIAELLPEQPGQYRYANADPITGQAAWYDLKVRIEKAAETGLWPDWPALKRPAGSKPSPRINRFGAWFRAGGAQ
ncbi:MAG: molybdopterin oxidoreductase family protein [Alphaproteobacteria bacterium]|nr:molybdopterin oxidoreductase family protein [Alphaproteobacteria bacterium]